MTVTAMGKRYARRIHDGTITIEDVPAHRLTETQDSYIELYGEPLDVGE